MDSLCFKLNDAELAIPRLLVLSALERAVVSSLIHTLRLGIYLDQQKTKGSEEHKSPLADTRTPSGKECQKYIASALSSDLTSDKLFPLRRTGSSMRFIIQELPLLHSPLSIFQLCIWRTFAFGNTDYLKQITLDLTSTTPDLPSIVSIITKWSKSQTHHLLSAYGQLQIIKKNIPDMLLKLWRFSEDAFIACIASSTPLTFADLRKRLGSFKISTVPHYGLISWLLTSDFFEFGICLEPTARDLADHLTHTKAGGARSALELVAEPTGEAAPVNVEDRAIMLQHILRACAPQL